MEQHTQEGEPERLEPHKIIGLGPPAIQEVVALAQVRLSKWSGLATEKSSMITLSLWIGSSQRQHNHISSSIEFCLITDKLFSKINIMYLKVTGKMERCHIYCIF